MKYYIHKRPKMAQIRFGLPGIEFLCQTDYCATYHYNPIRRRWCVNVFIREVLLNKSHYRIQEVERLYLAMRGIPEYEEERTPAA